MMHEDKKNKNSESFRNIESVRLGSDPAKRGAKGDGCSADLICEAAPKYGHAQDIRTETGTGWERQGEYTLEDYYALPDEKRVELIDGVFYDMASPGSIHQILAGAIHAEFLSDIRRNRGNCVPLISPMDVQIEKDEKTIVQPDVMIVCDREKFQNGIIYGAPDLVVEILSKSSRSRDCIIKLKKYYESGVREYWIVDPVKREITVYRFGDGEFQSKIYDSFASVPVGIFNDACAVDFNEIFDYVSFLGDAE